MNNTPDAGFGKSWLMLLALQVPLMAVVFWPFISGQNYLAYMDIGSDTFTAYTAIATNVARSLRQDGFTGWSFHIGLGSCTALWLGDVFLFLHTLAGPDNVLPLRIWVYLFKLILGGAAMLLLLRQWFGQWQVSVLGALAYSFCGYVVINGQWDAEGSVFIVLPLVLWAIVRFLQEGKWVAVPITVALALVGGTFFVALGVFLALSGLAFIALSEARASMFKVWLTRILPLATLGYGMATPILLPIVMQYLDGARVSGGQSLFDKVFAQGLAITDWSLIKVQLASLLHKDIFGVGSNYQGHWNYLEGPGFYIGVMPLILIAQLARGNAFERKALWWGLAAVMVYMTLPIIRLAAMGFGAPYFRVSTLWVTLVLLLLAVLALHRVLRDGVDSGMLWTAVVCVAGLVAWTALGDLGVRVSTGHVVKVLVLGLLTAVALSLPRFGVITLARLPVALIALVMLDVLLIARSSYLEGRSIVTPQNNSYRDGTIEAVRAIQAQDPGVYRVEKAYRSEGLADALVQDYAGVASYSFHSKTAADFHVASGLIPPPEQGPAVNYTNWLPDPGPRFVLQSLLGVKYLISREPLQWPGFTPLMPVRGLQIYRNDYALPLGVVYTRQLPRAQFDSLNQLGPERSSAVKDLVLLNTVVLEKPLPANGEPFVLNALLNAKELTLEEHYFKPARVLQSRGLELTTFSNTHLAGSVNTPQAGVLVLSMPLNRGWSAVVDGQPAELVNANMGLTGIPLTAGRHQIALNYDMPGLRAGLILGAFSWLLWLTLAWRHRSRAAATTS